MNRYDSMNVGGDAALRQLTRLRRWCLALAFLILFVGSQVWALENSEVHLYYFTNHGCPPCRQVAPEIDTLKREGYNVSTIVLSENPQWAERFQVQRVPTVLMMVNQRIVGRHEGLIGAQTLRQWFSVMGVDPPADQARSQRPESNRLGQGLLGGGRISGKNRPTSGSANPDQVNGSTRHKGTSVPANRLEHQAFQATVRLKVEDAQGNSYATGTVIHCHQGEWLVMTCGHAFREAGYQGRIVGEYNFADGQIRSAPAELISYDAGPRDIALVAMRTNETIEPIKIAANNNPPGVEATVFSLGCDQGADPTIRHTTIKHKALYDGAAKFVIHGRPTIGRSGGGLFNQAGELVGVCNAAMVDSDEGVYTSLETVHWQIAQANLTHLFADPASDRAEPRLAALNVDSQPTLNSETMPAISGAARSADLASSDMQSIQRNSSRNGVAGPANQPTGEHALANNLARSDDRFGDRWANGNADRSFNQQTMVNWDDQRTGKSATSHHGDDHEVIIIVRNKSDSRVGQSITINDPSPELLQYLDRMKDSKPESHQLEMARWRQLD